VRRAGFAQGEPHALVLSCSSDAKLNPFHSIQINRFPGLPEVELILHRKPALRGCAPGCAACSGGKLWPVIGRCPFG
jgi:hypothetical protein